MVLLHNCQTSKVGMNHTLNTFMSKTKGFKSYEFTHKNDGRELQLVNETANDFFLKVKKLMSNIYLALIEDAGVP